MWLTLSDSLLGIVPDTVTAPLGSISPDEPHQAPYEYTWGSVDRNEMVRVTAGALQRSITPALEDDVENHVLEAEKVLCIRQGDDLVGYMLLTFPMEGLVYIAGTMVTPAYQGNGLKAMATQVVMVTHPEVVYWAGRTQSSIVWASVTRAASVVLPNPEGTLPEMEMISARARLAAALGMTGAIHRGFYKDLYAAPLYGTKPIHRDQATQAWWDTLVNFDRGDAMLYIARM